MLESRELLGRKQRPQIAQRLLCLADGLPKIGNALLRIGNWFRQGAQALLDRAPQRSGEPTHAALGGCAGHVLP